MRLIFKSCLAGILITFSSLAVFAQEYVIPLAGNDVLQKQVRPAVKKSTGDIMLELPFEDDFSYRSHYPGIDLWAEDDAYVNSSYAVDPPSIGVATLDAVDYNGSVYPHATISPETFDADYLTSYPINLNYPASDSIYLSFFYQPQGTGLEPRPQDSLCLDFYSPATQVWSNIWRVPGDSLRDFEQVMISITDTSYLKEGFRFGFMNLASLPQNSDYRDKRGNVDHWNIDYVRLNRNRSYTDTVIRDVAFTRPIPSMLKNYEEIPWDHFGVGYNTIYLPYITLNYHNNDSATRIVTRRADIYNEVWDERFDPGNASTQDILPEAFVSHNINSVYPFNFNRGDTASYRIKAWIQTDDFDNKTNDTIYRTQRFRDYFAYDDGTAERAYGLRGQGTNNGLIAVKFNSFIADELGGVDIYFTQLIDSLNLDYYYKFMVWDDDEGIPGALLHSDPIDHTVVYSDQINHYTRFFFAEKVPVSGTFHVGLLQYNTYLLNIGMDINKPANGTLFYNIGNGWVPSEAHGSLMIRPFVDRPYSVSAQDPAADATVRIWPNPATELVRIEIPEHTLPINEISVAVRDITGRIIASYSGTTEIPVSYLPAGMYLFTVSSDQQIFRTERVIVK
ncbi:MAG: T9SS type A sorting domain-containing protein [Bacteroidales bacterium]|nr:T9SS type A sorting domain-containing protein [Bacteroidales bacterium]MDT8430849.1 T9SS type A sorting domain-containing protein [Bacteroidales bacterium]